MNNTLYRKLEADELIKDGDVYGSSFNQVSISVIGMPYVPSSAYTILRPVSIERVTGTESAFPAFDGSGAVGGMTLRECYAGLAMQGFATLITPENVKIHLEKGPKMPIEDYMAILSVQMADALIAALNKKEEVV